MGWLDNEVVLVTGAGSGLGRAIVERFVAEGASVGVLELNPEKAGALAADFGDKVCVVIGDATSYGDNERAVRQTVNSSGASTHLLGTRAFGTSGRRWKRCPSSIYPLRSTRSSG